MSKADFPRLLKAAIDKVEMKNADNIKGGFKGAGIIPFDPEHVFNKFEQMKSAETLAEEGEGISVATSALRDSVTDLLQSMRLPEKRATQRRRKLNVPPGKSISSRDLNGEATDESVILFGNTVY